MKTKRNRKTEGKSQKPASKRGTRCEAQTAESNQKRCAGGVCAVEWKPRVSAA
jgi:hypothetical protein